MAAFPVDLRVENWPVLVVGGGHVAVRRIDALLACEATVTVVSPQVRPNIAAWHSEGAIHWRQRGFHPGDAKNMRLVLGCTDDATVSDAVAKDARAHGALVSIADVPELCDLYFGAIARQGSVTLAVHTDGTAPAMAARLRDQLATQLTKVAAQRTAALSVLRRRIRMADSLPEHASKRAEFLRGYGTGDVLDDLRTIGGIERAVARYRDTYLLKKSIPKSSPLGHVSIVGAGPGDPELLTVRASQRIASANTLVVDGLIPKEIFEQATGRVIVVAKRVGTAHVSQDEIGATLVRHALLGEQVVRLKGGDPGLFGHLHEEIDVLRAAGIPFDIVPGISSALAAPLAAKVAVTARSVADQVLILSGHSPDESTRDTAQLPSYLAQRTLIVLMGLQRIASLAQNLRNLGYPTDLPVIAVSRMGLCGERMVTATLETIADAILVQQLQSPTTMIIGWAAMQQASTAQQCSVL